MVTCRILAKRISAGVKIRDFSPIQFATQSRFPIRGLLGGALRSPVNISFPVQSPRLAALWRPAQVLWEQHQRAEAIARLDESTQGLRKYACVNIPTMLLASHLRIEAADNIGAARCLQAAVRNLGQQSGIRLGTIFPTASRLLAAETTHPYVLCDHDWLVMAIHALLKNDLESCLLWIHQADCGLFDSFTASDSPGRLRLIGDLHATLACVAVQANEPDEAEKFLRTAYERHSQAEAFQSICRDLILTSRLAAMQGQIQRANSLLNAAECQLVMSLTEIEADRSPLMEIIRSGRAGADPCNNAASHSESARLRRRTSTCLCRLHSTDNFP